MELKSLNLIRGTAPDSVHEMCPWLENLVFRVNESFPSAALLA
jgi:hypothetical protein